MIAVSTIAFGNKSIEDIINIAKKEGWMLEFSSGLTYRPDLIEIYLKADIPRLPHNYFPPPEEPFVLNLASQNEAIRKRSIQHCKQGLDLAKASNSPFFAAHAGFCGDPEPEELGKPINFDPDFDRNKYWDKFISSVQEVLDYAEEKQVDFLIENNVCAAFNLVNETRNPLLCSDPFEITKLFKKFSSQRFGLLLDTGHFKVSGNTLGFNNVTSIKKIKEYIKGIHHNDNDGLVDSNYLLQDNYWFKLFISEFNSLTHVLEVKCNSQLEKIYQQINHIKFFV